MITADLTNHRALITGGASGIGLATATLFARAGATVAINDLADNPALQIEVERLKTEGLKVIAAPGDTGDVESINHMVANAVDHLGGLDYLINNAATPGTRSPISPADFQTQNEEFWHKLLSVNLLGPYHCTVAAEKALRASKGAIVNTASTAGIKGNGSSSVYAATKAALINMTREHARAFGPDVRVNAIAPGVVSSNWECQFERGPDYLNSLPLKRAGMPEDFAETILFLCAGAAYITGEIIVVDGGMTAGPAV